MSKINFQKITEILHKKKKIAILTLIILTGVSFWIFNSGRSNTVNIDSVRLADLKNSVQATGQVVSNTDLDLSFNKAGVVKSIKVGVGDQVKAGQILATLDQGQALAILTEAKGALLGAAAKYNKILEGSSSEEIALAEVAFINAEKDLENTKNSQAILVANAYRNFLNSDIAAFSTSSQTTPTITGTYTPFKEGEINISAFQTGSGGYFDTSGLVNCSGSISTTNPQPICSTGLFIQFPETNSNSGYWFIPIPNTKADDYLTNYNAYQNALQNKMSIISTAQSLVDQKKAELNLKKAVARNTDVDIAKAEVLSKEGSLQSAQSSYEDTVIRAPALGTITKVNIKYGELSEAGKSVITLEDVNNLYIEASINEANIAYLKVGQNVSITFDAFGPDKKFTGVIIHIDPSSETNDGVVNYKIKVSIESKDDTIRPGMNANIDVLAGEVKNVLVIPNAAVMHKESKSFVNFITDEKKKKYEEREVMTGFVGDNNLVQIISGLKQDDKIVLTEKDGG